MIAIQTHRHDSGAEAEPQSRNPSPAAIKYLLPLRSRRLQLNRTRAPRSVGNKGDAAAASKAAATTTICVELEKIDRVVNMVGELVSQAMLGQVMEDLEKPAVGCQIF
jgi:chemotaxis protein histidine kinase CheA